MRDLWRRIVERKHLPFPVRITQGEGRGRRTVRSCWFSGISTDETIEETIGQWERYGISEKTRVYAISVAKRQRNARRPCKE